MRKTSASTLYRVCKPGRSPTVVFLHGLGGTHRYWSCVGHDAVLPSHAVIDLDLLGFGDSPKPWTRYTRDRHLAAIHAALAGHGELVLVGHSMGAALALAYAAQYPQRVRGLCLISLPHYGGLEGAQRWFAKQRGGWVYTNVWATALACVLTRRVAARLLPAFLGDVPPAVAEDLAKHTMVSSTSSLWEVLYRHDLAADASLLPTWVPVRCIHGAADTTAPLFGVQSLARGRANWHIELLDGVDHHPWLRAPGECTSAIRMLVDDVADALPPRHYDAPTARVSPDTRATRQYSQASSP